LDVICNEFPDAEGDVLWPFLGCRPLGSPVEGMDAA